MIAFLKGALAAKTIEQAYIDVNGVGFAVFMSGRSLDRIGQIGDDVQVLTRLIVREDGMTLYGFASQSELTVFDKLITVSGIGPKVALSALSAYDSQELIALIANQDLSAVQRIPGIGKKTASRIVLELKDSFDDATMPLSAAVTADSSTLTLAQEALLSMGFSSAEAAEALKDAPADAPESVLIQYALKHLGS